MRQPADPVEQIKHSKTAVGDEDQRTLRQPARDQRDHLPGAFGQLLLLPLFGQGVAFGRTDTRRSERASPRPRPPNRDQQQTTEPTQPAGFDKTRVRRAHRIALDAFGYDLRAAPPFNRVVPAEDLCAGRGESRKQQSSRRPASSADQRARVSTR